MFRKVVFLSAILMALVCLASLTIEAKGKTVRSKSKSVPAIKVRKKVSDESLLVYSHVFYTAIQFSKQSLKPENESFRQFLEHFFIKQAGLSAAQDAALKAVARGFVNRSPMLSYRQKIELLRSSRNQLRMYLGPGAFRRFDKFVRETVAPKIKIVKDQNNMTIYGAGSSIYVDGTQLIGTSYTVFYNLHGGGCGGSVSATMTGPGVSLSGSGVCGPQDSSVSVTLVSPTFQPNSQYCIDGQHAAVAGGTATTHECITTPGGPPRVTSLNYELIQTDDLAIDTNPNASGGFRIFPDKKIPTETVDRRRILVKAQYSETTAGVRIYFRNFDVDDPSADVAPIDTNDTATAKLGNDNNGNVDGTTATRGGQMIVPAAGQPNPYNCQPFSNATGSGVSCETDASGVAKADFIVTQQPGDNFAVVAGPDETYVSSLVPAADGINLMDATNIQTPVTTTASNACATSTVTACRADMLTVWRRLHIEVDSMGRSTANYERGEVEKKTKIGRGKTKTLNVNIIANNPLGVNRFENGRMELATITAVLEVVSNTTNSLTVRNFTSNNIVLASGVNYELSSQDNLSSAIGMVPIGVTITPSQTLTISVEGTPMAPDAFSQGSMSITPALRSLAIKSNTADKVEVTNNGTVEVEIEAAAHFRLYDDDDMDNTSPTNAGSLLNGDEGEDVPDVDTSLLADSDDPVDNLFAPAYVRPTYDLQGNNIGVPFIESPTDRGMTVLLSAPFFNNFATEASTDFWTIYLLGAYQPPRYDPVLLTLIRDGDPVIYSTTGQIATVFGAANSGSTEQTSTTPFVRNNIGQGCLLFTEVGRPSEYPTGYGNRPISRAYTTAHEVGHLFRGVHVDGDLMAPTPTRTVGTFSGTSLSIIRQTIHP